MTTTRISTSSPSLTPTHQTPCAASPWSCSPCPTASHSVPSSTSHIYNWLLHRKDQRQIPGQRAEFPRWLPSMAQQQQCHLRSSRHGPLSASDYPCRCRPTEISRSLQPSSTEPSPRGQNDAYQTLQTPQSDRIRGADMSDLGRPCDAQRSGVLLQPLKPLLACRTARMRPERCARSTPQHKWQNIAVVSVVREPSTMPPADGLRDLSFMAPGNDRAWLCKIAFDEGEEIRWFLDRKKTSFVPDSTEAIQLFRVRHLPSKRPI